ncbi:hypothetical protein BDW22DRAFT_1353201 [Trametopsis cervina]|nr:hypothetical protein BDW22DRAFT_1353201 [Trametopsis cervina]
MAIRSLAAIFTVFVLVVGVAIATESDTRCQPGTWSSTGYQPCDQCPGGTYQSQYQSTSCTLAQEGWYATGPGATSQSQCGKGRYSSSGSAQCIDCPPGTHCNGYTNGAPQLCEPGRYQATPGATDCTQCPAGSFSNTYGATSCCWCCSGWYTDQVGQTHCFNCPNRGSFQQGWSPVGATDAKWCIAAEGAMESCSMSGNTCPPTGGTSPSGSPERRSNSNNRPKSPRPHRCQHGQKSCPIYGTAFGRGYLKAYNCLDTLNELESCGGCVSNDSPDGEVNKSGGRDCSAIPYVDSVRCEGGKCVIESCIFGHVVSPDSSRCIQRFMAPGPVIVDSLGP